MSIEAMRQALEALYMANTREWPENKIGTAINALSAAIEQAEKQDPVGEVLNERGEIDYISYVPPVGTPLYTAQRQRVTFPTMLRKMWSGREVQAWLDENVNKEKNT